MPDPYVLDTFGLMALLNEEAGAEQVAEILRNANHLIHMSAINLGEAYYIIARRRGLEAAEEAVAAMLGQPNFRLSEASWGRIRAAAAIKARGRLSYADAVAASLANELSAPLLTGDPEFRALEEQGIIEVIWLPR